MQNKPRKRLFHSQAASEREKLGGNMISADDHLDGTFPFKPHFIGAPGHRLHYVDEGQGEPVMLIHGLPTWSYLYRKIIPYLSEDRRIIAPDYLGFGKSDTPSNIAYTVSTHVDALEQLVLELDLSDMTLVLHDWGGAIGAGIALRHPDRIRRLVVMNTLMPLGLEIEAQLLPEHNLKSDWFSWATPAEARGDLEIVMRNLKFTVLSLMRWAGLQNLAQVDETWLRAYSQPFASPEECTAAYAFPKSVVTETVQFETAGTAAVEKLRAKPAMMIYGMKDRALLPDYLIPIFQASFPSAPVFKLANAGHFLQEDAPETVALLIKQFMEWHSQ